MPSNASYAKVRRLALVGLLWAGLALCVLAVVRYWHESSALLGGINFGGLLFIGISFSIMWLSAVSSWRKVVAVCGGNQVPWGVATRHFTLLLLGKYVPGGVWGFLARLSDSTAYGSLASMTAAGLVEQWIGLVMVGLVGAAALAAAYWSLPIALLVVVLFPPMVVASLQIMRKLLDVMTGYLPARWRFAAGALNDIQSRRQLYYASGLTMLQVIFILGITLRVAAGAFHSGTYAALAVAGCYAMGIAAGIAAVFVPGGILVREAIFVLLSRHWLAATEAIALAGALRLIFTAFDLLAGVSGACIQFWRTSNVR